MRLLRAGKGGFNAVVLRQPDHIAQGRKNHRTGLVGRILDHLPRPDPDRVDIFMTIMAGNLIVRATRQIEMRVEALGHHLGGDPVGEVREIVAGQVQIALIDQIAKCQRLGIEPIAPGIRNFGGRNRRTAAPPCQQDAGLFKDLANRSRAQHRLLSGLLLVGGEPADHTLVRILRIDLAARKNQRPGRKIDLVVAHDHEDLQPLGAVAQQHDGSCSNRLGDRLISGLRHGVSPSCLVERTIDDRRSVDR